MRWSGHRTINWLADSYAVQQRKLNWNEIVDMIWFLCILTLLLAATIFVSEYLSPSSGCIS